MRPITSPAAAGTTTTRVSFWRTRTATDALAVPEVAVIVATPLSAAVRRPADVTVATLVADDWKAIAAPGRSAPEASLTTALNCTMSPTENSVSTAAGVSARFTTVELGVVLPELHPSATTIAAPRR